jgi:hypothetical protein
VTSQFPKPSKGSLSNNLTPTLSLENTALRVAPLATISPAGPLAGFFLRWDVRQGMRIFVKPGAFFNQLQWSRHHWLILFSFLLIAAIETHVGSQHALLDAYSQFLSTRFGIPFDIALWLAVCAKLVFMLTGALVVGHIIWFVGSFFGERNSKRVLFRRLAVVFTVTLAAFTASHLSSSFLWMATASQFLYLWSALLGFIAIREQFDLGFAETLVVGTLAALLVMGSWIFSNEQLEKMARNHMNGATSVAKSTAKTMKVKPPRF